MASLRVVGEEEGDLSAVLNDNKNGFGLNRDNLVLKDEYQLNWL